MEKAICDMLKKCLPTLHYEDILLMLSLKYLIVLTFTFRADRLGICYCVQVGFCLHVNS